MAFHEQDMIALFKAMQQPQRDDIVAGIGDDAAICQPPAGQCLVTSTDTLNIDVHFPANLPPADIGYRSVMVNLSDLAACGATSHWLQLALTLPTADEDWLTQFIAGFSTALTETNTQCVGGDITRGPLSLTVQAMGFAPVGAAIRRDSAQPGDDIYVSCELGAAALGCQLLCDQRQLADAKMTEEAVAIWKKPTAQLALGVALRGVATAAIDLSDGLATDGQHLCRASQVSGQIELVLCPIADVVKAACSPSDAIVLALTGGEDYGLCFTAAPKQRQKIQDIASAEQLKITRIGQVVSTQGASQLSFLNETGEHIEFHQQGYQHF